MASSYDPSQLDEPIMQVRHLIGDVYDFEFLSESEIQFALDNAGGNVYVASSDCCKAIAARLARNTDFKFSTLWNDSSQAMKHFLSLSEELKKMSVEKIGFEVIYTGEQGDPIFEIGQFDHSKTRTNRSRGVFSRD